MPSRHFADSLVAEMEPLGVQVSAIEPANFNTELARNAVKRIGMYHAAEFFDIQRA